MITATQIAVHQVWRLTRTDGKYNRFWCNINGMHSPLDKGCEATVMAFNSRHVWLEGADERVICTELWRFQDHWELIGGER